MSGRNARAPVGAAVRASTLVPRDGELIQYSDVVRKGVAISPDGLRVAYIGRKDGPPRLHLRALDRFDSVALTGTGAWRQHTFHVTDAYFGNRQNYGSDFRISGGVGNTF